MKTGLELIRKERENQISKGRSIEKDIQINKDKQLLDASVLLMLYEDQAQYSDYEYHECVPDGWDLDIWVKMCRKPYIERLSIAGALVSAEIDRLLNQ